MGLTFVQKTGRRKDLFIEGEDMPVTAHEYNRGALIGDVFYGDCTVVITVRIRLQLQRSAETPL